MLKEGDLTSEEAERLQQTSTTQFDKGEKPVVVVLKEGDMTSEEPGLRDCNRPVQLS